jgi:hypothetical protein
MNHIKEQIAELRGGAYLYKADEYADTMQAMLDVVEAAQQVIKSSAMLPDPNPDVCWMSIDDGERLEEAIAKLGQSPPYIAEIHGKPQETLTDAELDAMAGMEQSDD